MRVNFSDKTREGEWLFVIIVFLYFLIIYFAWYPGVFTRDEEDIVAQGLSGNFHDGHSPLLVRLWQLTGMVKIGPSIPYFIALSSTIFFSALLVRRVLISSLISSIALLLFFLAPPVFVSMGLVTKDLFFVASMLMVFWSLTKYLEGKRFIQAAMVLLAIQFAVLIRIDAIFALLPIVIYLFWTVFDKYIFTRLISNILAVTLGIVMLFMILVSARSINRVVFDAKPYHAEQVMMLFDLASISIQVDQMLIPSSRLGQEGYPLSLLKARFSPAAADPILWGADGYHFLYAPNADHIELRDAWIDAIRKYPGAYARGRAEYASRFVGIRNNSPWLMGQFFADESMVVNLPQQGWLRTKSPLQEFYGQISLSQWLHYIYVPWVWILAGMFFIVLWMFRSIDDQPSIISKVVPQLLVISAISYTFLMCMVSASALARYHSWPRIAIGLVVAMAIASFMNDKKHIAVLTNDR